jgi:nucleotide-binding universal stress UspA family protein
VSHLFDRILVAIDDSEPGKTAVTLGARLAREHNGELILCHSVNWLPLVVELESSGAVIDPEPTLESMSQHGESLLVQAELSAQAQGVRARCHLTDGEPAKAILMLAGKLDCRLIVMGTNARGGLERLFIGSTTEAVLRGSTIPVLTVHPGTKLTPEPQRCFERIVVGTDASETARAAVEAVIELAAADACHVLFCSVVDIDSVVGSRGYYDTAIHAGLYDNAQRAVDDAVKTARGNDVGAEGRIADGSASRGLVALAKRENADLIVTGSHGRGGVRRMLLGSVAETVVRTSPVPVLVIRSAARAKASGARAKRQAAAVR